MNKKQRICEGRGCGRIFNSNYPWSKFCSHFCQNKETIYNATRRKLKEIFEFFGSKCAHCGFDNPLALQIDHVNGGGKKERIIRTGTATFYRHVLKEIKSGSKEYQLLCANCNWIKRFINNERPGSSSTRF